MGVVILPVWTVCWCCHSAGVDCVLVLSFCRCGLTVFGLSMIMLVLTVSASADILLLLTNCAGVAAAVIRMKTPR